MAYETYYGRYNELTSQYKIAKTYNNGCQWVKTGNNWNDGEWQPINQDDYDIVIDDLGSGYAHHKYKAIKNIPNLSNKDLAIICDRGNLCFGYRVEYGNIICVHTD